MATAALTLGIVGLFTWIIPFLGFPVSVVGIILATMAILIRKEHKNRALAGLVLCVLGLIGNIIVVIIGVAAIGMLGILGQILEEFYMY
jgi:Na+/H+ antiporter NhaD/arsenite permease-like protein